MAIRDLLWACPECGDTRGLRPGAKDESCPACGARFRRGPGSTIEVTMPAGTRRSLPAAAWVDRLPRIDDFRPRTSPDIDEPGLLHREQVTARFATGRSSIRHNGRYLNWIESLGEPRSGVLVLEDTRLVFHDSTWGATLWGFADITGVQPSSSTLQIKARHVELVSFRFPNGSARFWEELICAALQRYYRSRGRGEIVEFQPRITTRR